jgi:hypothetical protein
MYYRLENRRPVKCETGDEWENWCETARQSDCWIIAREPVNDCMVTTSFISINVDPAFDADGRPLLFETLVFKDGTVYGDMTARYLTWEEAEAGHGEIVPRVREMWPAEA